MSKSQRADEEREKGSERACEREREREGGGIANFTILVGSKNVPCGN